MVIRNNDCIIHWVLFCILVTLTASLVSIFMKWHFYT